MIVGMQLAMLIKGEPPAKLLLIMIYVSLSIFSTDLFTIAVKPAFVNGEGTKFWKASLCSLLPALDNR